MTEIARRRPIRRNRRSARRRLFVAAITAALTAAVAALSPAPASAAPPTIAGRRARVLPADDIWNTPVDRLPVHRSSDAWVRAIGADAKLKADFGSGLWNGGPIGIPFVVVGGDQKKVKVTFEYADESDAGLHPIPRDARIEAVRTPRAIGTSRSSTATPAGCTRRGPPTPTPTAAGAPAWAIFDLRHDRRPDGWTSADAAGLPILARPFVRYDEVAAGEIDHAILGSRRSTQRLYLWPASRPAMPTCRRWPADALEGELMTSGYPPPLQVILRALKRYGMLNADNGSAWFLSGVPDERWGQRHAAAPPPDPGQRVRGRRRLEPDDRS
ncbi:MAG: hypothetical protein U0470_02180 [Anaerolineae bacterium]